MICVVTRDEKIAALKKDQELKEEETWESIRHTQTLLPMRLCYSVGEITALTVNRLSNIALHPASL